MVKVIGIYFKDILDSIIKIEKYTKRVSKKSFSVNTKLQDAVIRRIEIMGEAVKRIPQEVLQKYSNIPWKDIAGMRDVIVHHYDRIDLEEVWKVVKEDIPRLKPDIEILV